MGDGAILTLACNLGSEAAAIEPIRQDLLFATSETVQTISARRKAWAIYNARPHGAAMKDAAVYSLAERAGIAIEWRDYTERPHRVSLDTIRHILAAIGLPCQTADDLAESRHRLDARAPPPVITGHNRSADAHVPCRRRAFAAEHQRMRMGPLPMSTRSKRRTASCCRRSRRQATIRSTSGHSNLTVAVAPVQMRNDC